MQDFRKILGQRLRAFRKAQGQSQATLAEATGLTENMISRYENGAQFPRFDTLEQLATALGTTPAQLFGSDRGGPPERAEALAELDAVIAGKGVEVVRLLTYLARRLPQDIDAEK